MWLMAARNGPAPDFVTHAAASAQAVRRRRARIRAASHPGPSALKYRLPREPDSNAVTPSARARLRIALIQSQLKV